MNTSQLATVATLTLTLTAGIAAARTFTTVLNIGTDPNAGVMFDGSSVGGGVGFVSLDNLSGNVLGSDGQLNLFNGGSILNGFNVGPTDFTGSNIEVNIFGGNVGGTNGAPFAVRTGSAVNVLGGSLNTIVAFDATLNISGGSFGGEVFVDSSSAFNVFGTAFFLDGVELTDLVAGQAFTIDLNGSSVGNFLSGNLADGSAFNFFIGGFESGALVTITLVPAPATGAILAAAGLLTIRRRRR